jgi:hypothetical protein
VFLRLQGEGKELQAGGLAYINALGESVTSARGIKRHAEIVKDKARHRALLAAADISLEGVTEVGQGLIENLVARSMVRDWNKQNPQAQLPEPPAWSNEAAWQQFKAGAGMGIIYKVAGGAGGKLRNMAKAKGPAAGPAQAGAFEPAVEAQPEVEQPAQPVAPVQQPAAAPEPEPAVAAAAPVEPVPVRASSPAVEAAGEEAPLVGPVVKPIVIGDGPLPVERKRGWWKR